MIDLANLTKKREDRKQLDAAKKLVNIAEEIVDFIATKELQTFEARILPKLVAERIETIVGNHIQPLAFKDIIPKKEEEKK